MRSPSVNSHAVVIGARGFIGSALTAALRRDQHEVIELVRNTPSTPWATDWDKVLDARTIYWAASTINPKIASENPDRVEADHRAFAGFLSALERDGSQARVVLLSSGGTVYGSATRPPFSEDIPATPTSEYGRAKLRLESELLERNLQGLVVRVSNAYGPGQRIASGQGVIGHWLRSLRDNETICVYGGPEIIRDYLYIDDLVSLLTSVHTALGRLPTILNAGSGTPTTLSTILCAVEDVSDEHAPLIVHYPARDFDLRESWLDVTQAHEALGWQARVRLEDGIAAMWNWLISEIPAS